MHAPGGLNVDRAGNGFAMSWRLSDTVRPASVAPHARPGGKPGPEPGLIRAN